MDKLNNLLAKYCSSSTSAQVY